MIMIKNSPNEGDTIHDSILFKSYDVSDDDEVEAPAVEVVEKEEEVEISLNRD